MGLNAAPFQNGLTKAKASAMQFHQGLNQLGAGIGALGMLALAKRAADAAAELKRTGEAVGETVEEVQALGFAASQNGSSIEEMNKALTRLAVNIGKANAGEAEAIRKFEDYGISIRNAKGELLSTSAVLDQIADRIQDSGGGADAAAIAFELLGKSGVGLVQTLGDGAEGLANLKRLAQESGDVISTDANDAIVELTDTLNRHLGGALSWVTDKIGKLILGIKQFSVILGTLFADFEFEALLNPFEALQEFEKLGGNFDKAIAAANAVAKTEDARKAIDSQLKKLESLAPILDKIKKLEQERAQAAESTAQKVERIKKEEEELAKLLKDKTEKQIRGDQKLLNAKLKQLEKQKELQKETNALAARENQIREQSNRLQAQLAKQVASLKDTKADRSRFTIEELATGNAAGVSDESVRDDIFRAQQFVRLQQEAEAARLRGDVGTAGNIFNQADKLRDQIVNLKSSERPFRGMEEGIKATKSEIEKLNAKADGEGINLKQVILK